MGMLRYPRGGWGGGGTLTGVCMLPRRVVGERGGLGNPPGCLETCVTGTLRGVGGLRGLGMPSLSQGPRPRAHTGLLAVLQLPPLRCSHCLVSQAELTEVKAEGDAARKELHQVCNPHENIA